MTDEPDDRAPWLPFEDLDSIRLMEALAAQQADQPSRLVPARYSVEEMREKLEEICAETKDAARTARDRAKSGTAARPVRFNMNRDLPDGRLSFLAANVCTDAGLHWLDAEDLARAEICLANAEGFLLDAYRRARKAKDRQKMSRWAKPGGRPKVTGSVKKTAERNRRLAVAYNAQRAAGKPRRTALIAARDSDLELRGLSYPGLEKALTEGRRLLEGAGPRPARRSTRGSKKAQDENSDGLLTPIFVEMMGSQSQPQQAGAHEPSPDPSRRRELDARRHRRPVARPRVHRRPRPAGPL